MLNCPSQALYCDNSENVPHLLAAVFDAEHDLATEFSTRQGNDEHTRSGFVNGLPADDISLDRVLTNVGSLAFRFRRGAFGR